MKQIVISALFVVLSLSGRVAADLPDWKHSGSIYVLTTPDGANLPAKASVENFPILVRLHSDFFDFRQAQPKGDDLRFSTVTGEALAYQIEEWDATKGVASIWVRVPKIAGNAKQELKLHWGKADAKSESNGKAVFNEANGYLSVWHMNATGKDELGTLDTKDTGTTATPGVVGLARHFPGQKGIFGGDKIPNYPAGASSHSTEAWFRAEKINTTILGWGNEGGVQGSKIRMQLRSPAHIHIDSDFSDVDGTLKIPLREWVHVVHTYDRNDGRIYINGKLDASAKPLLNIQKPARFWIGGWYNDYDFIGDIDEVRISTVARSADWVRLQYENQKPTQTLVGPLVQAGDAFSVSQDKVTVDEGKSVIISAKAGGALKTYWIVKRNGQETVAATDRFSFQFDAGRVVGDTTLSLQFKAVYPNEVKIKEIPVTIRETIAEPAFTLQAPTDWDGRQTIEIVPAVTNFNFGADLKYKWSVDGLAVIKAVDPYKLILKRAQNSGKLTVSVAIDNGGTPTVHSTTIMVKEPAKDAWVERVPLQDEKPVEGQFYARDDKNEGTLSYNGTLTKAADSVFLKLYANGKFIETLTQKPKADKSYAISMKLKPGLIVYKVEFGTKTGDTESVQNTIGDLVCGDAYLIHGQSNAVATDFGKDDPTFRSEWIRTYGSMSSNPKEEAGWGRAIHRGRNSEKFQIGYWGMELGRRLVENQKIPICFINGAMGGTRIDQHQRNTIDPEDKTTIYGRLLRRVRQAELTHGIRGVIWHQGENDQGADGPTGGYGYENYREYFLDLAAAWKQDFPNIQHYYLFQIWPKSCSMGINGSDNRLREVQRQLPSAFSSLSIMSTLGIDPPGGCHFPAAGYAEFARLICPVIERNQYGFKGTAAVTAANLKQAYYSDDKNNSIILEFDQPVKWNNVLLGQFYCDGAKGKFASGSVDGNRLTLKLNDGTKVKNITYLDSAAWGQDKILRGLNGIAALTFCEVPVKLDSAK